MVTLDNFHTGNNPRPLHPALPARYARIRHGLHNNRDWDLANQQPVAPVATYQPGSRASAHPNAQVEERLSTRGLRQFLVPTKPYTHFRYNDTVSGVQLVMDNPHTEPSWWTRFLGRRAAVPTYSRFHPYLR